MATKVELLQDRFTRTVEQGYQAALTWHQGLAHAASPYVVFNQSAVATHSIDQSIMKTSSANNMVAIGIDQSGKTELRSRISGWLCDECRLSRV